LPYQTDDWIHLENPEYSDEDFRKTEAGKVNVVGTINLGRGIQARLALLKGPGDETGIYVYLFSRREPYNWTMEKATEWLQAHLAKQGVFSFNYLASVEVYNPMKHLAKIKILDTTVNSNRWQVTDEALKRALDTLIGRPLIAYPDHSGDVVAGLFVDAQKPDGYAVGIAEILDLDSWEKIMRGEWRFVSPKVTAYAVSKRNGVDIIEDFEFEHVAFVPRGAYPSAQVLSTYAGEESSLRSFSAALTEKLEELKTQNFEARVIPFDPKTKADEDQSWVFNAADYDANQLKTACAWYNEKKPDIKASYKLPHHLPDGRVVWRGVAAAMAALLGARTPLDVPAEDRRGIFEHLKKHYDQFGKTPPEFHADLLQKEKEGEDWKMSENAHDKELAEANAKIEKLEAANKNLRELLEQKTKTPYEVEIAKLKSQIEHFQADNEKLSENLSRFEGERHQAKVQELLGLRASLGFTPSNEELERFQGMADDILNQLIEDTKDLTDRGSYNAIPKAKYAGDRKLSTEDRVRLRLLGHIKEGE